MYPKTVEELPASIRTRVVVERLIIHQLVADLLEAGCELKVDDGDAQSPWTTNLGEVLDALMNTDEDTLYVRRASDQLRGWVLLVYGNDGWDVICDHTTNLTPLLARVNALAEKWEAMA